LCVQRKLSRRRDREREVGRKRKRKRRSSRSKRRRRRGMKDMHIYINRLRLCRRPPSDGLLACWPAGLLACWPAGVLVG